MKPIEKTLPIREYHEHEAIGSTTVKSAIKSGRSYLRAKTGDFTGSKAKSLGDAFHAYVLEPERFDEMYTLSESRGKPFLSPDIDVEKISPAEYEKFVAMASAIEDCKEAQDLLESACLIECSFFAELDFINKKDGKPFACKARPDFITKDGWIVDLKTVGRSADADSFCRDFFAFGYDVQMAFYTDVVEKAIGKKIKGFKFLCVEAVSKDSGVKIYTFNRSGDDWYNIGKKRMEEGFENINKFEKTQKFDVYETVEEISLPVPYMAQEYLDNEEITV